MECPHPTPRSDASLPYPARQALQLRQRETVNRPPTLPSFRSGSASARSEAPSKRTPPQAPASGWSGEETPSPPATTPKPPPCSRSHRVPIAADAVEERDIAATRRSLKMTTTLPFLEKTPAIWPPGQRVNFRRSFRRILAGVTRLRRSRW